MLIANDCSLGSGKRWTIKARAEGIERAALQGRKEGRFDGLVLGSRRRVEEKMKEKDSPDSSESS